MKAHAFEKRGVHASEQEKFYCALCGFPERDALHVTSKTVKVEVQVDREEEEILADVALTLREASEFDATLREGPLESEEDYNHVAGKLLTFASKLKFLDDERKVTVTPMNNEVTRINDWYRPALDALKALQLQGKALLKDFILKQQAAEREAVAAAEAAAKAALAAPTPTTQAAATAATALAAKVSPVPVTKGVSHKPVWKWVVKDPASVPRAFLMPDKDKIALWVAEHGNKDVPSGVEVTEDVSFRVSKK